MAEIKDLLKIVDSLTDEDKAYFLQLMALEYIKMIDEKKL